MDKNRTGKIQIDLNRKTILVTGAAGFIGAALVRKLLAELEEGVIIGIDNLSAYYDPSLKRDRLNRIEHEAAGANAQYIFLEGSISDQDFLQSVFGKYHPEIVVNLAAQPGIRHSIDHPDEYITTNIVGFFYLLEACRKNAVRHLVFASSSSVYGERKEVPFRPEDRTDEPLSLYAATKKSDEVLAYSYAKLYGIPSTGLRFFTVYGPAGRPDMFYYSAALKMMRGERLRVFNHGKSERDFTYIDDITEGIYRVMRQTPEAEAAAVADAAMDARNASRAPYALYNIGAGEPVNLMVFLRILKDEMIQAGLLPADYDLNDHCDFSGSRPGDAEITYADTASLQRDFGFRPEIDIRQGLRRFVRWLKDYSGE